VRAFFAGKKHPYYPAVAFLGGSNSTTAKLLRRSALKTEKSRNLGRSSMRRLQSREEFSDSEMDVSGNSPLLSGNTRTDKAMGNAKKSNSSPLWNIPNILTMLRVLAIPVFGVIFFWDVEWRNLACSSIFAIASITDWLDGYLARKWNISSPFGAFLDPVADKLMVSTALILLTGRLQGISMPLCCSIILAREIGVSALREWMAQIGERGKVAVGYAGKVKTAATMVSLVLLLLMQPGASSYGLPSFFFQIGMVLLYISTVVTVTSGWGYLQAAWPALMGKTG